jgi:hypothetical protein
MTEVTFVDGYEVRAVTTCVGLSMIQGTVAWVVLFIGGVSNLVLVLVNKIMDRLSRASPKHIKNKHEQGA